MAFRSMAILGGKGMLGSDLADTARQQGISVHVYDLPEFDLTDDEQVRQAVSACEVVVNCAAYTNVEKAESEPHIADEINGYAVERLGQIARAAGIPVLHISTDFVFDGTKAEPYAETDPTHPVSAYGRSKLLGETLLAASGCEHCIIRVQWTYGKTGVNFITKILDASKKRDSLTVVDDQVGSPTHTKEAAKAICDCLQQKTFPVGLYHFAAAGYTSRFEMTRFLFDAMAVKTPVLPCKTSDFKTAAQRPLNSCFSCEKIQQLLDRPIPSWQDMLTSYLETL